MEKLFAHLTQLNVHLSRYLTHELYLQTRNQMPKVNLPMHLAHWLLEKLQNFILCKIAVDENIGCIFWDGLESQFKLDWLEVVFV